MEDLDKPFASFWGKVLTALNRITGWDNRRWAKIAWLIGAGFAFWSNNLLWLEMIITAMTIELLGRAFRHQATSQTEALPRIIQTLLVLRPLLMCLSLFNIPIVFLGLLAGTLAPGLALSPLFNAAAMYFALDARPKRKSWARNAVGALKRFRLPSFQPRPGLNGA